MSNVLSLNLPLSRAMKAILTLVLSLCVFPSAHAQAFRPRLGYGSHFRSGPRVGHGSYSGAYRHHGGYRGWARPSFSFYYSNYGWDPLPVYSYAYAGDPVYVAPTYAPPPPSRAASGLFWGGLLGAIVGNNSGSLGHNAWRGAAYGAGAGLLLGALSDHAARERDTAVARAIAYPPSIDAPVAAPSAPDRPPAPPPAARRPASPMSGANSLFGRN